MHLALTLLMASFLSAQTDYSIPLNARWDQYLDRTFNWKTLALVTTENAVEQSFQVRKCVRPPYCFPHHLGGSMLRRTMRSTAEFGASALLQEDLRRQPSGLTGFRKRMVFALAHAPLARTNDGSWRPAYSRYTGTVGAVIFSSAWHGRPITFGNVASSVGWTMTSYFQDAVLTEFEPDLRRFGLRTWHRMAAAARVR